jgi:hypothetical protein
MVKRELAAPRQELRAVRPIRQKRTTRLTRLAPARRLAQASEPVRKRLIEAISPGHEVAREEV